MGTFASTVKRVTVGAAFGGALVMSVGVGGIGGGMGIANAEPNDGQVDLALGTAGVLDDVPIGAASQIAAAVCDIEVGQVTPKAQTADVSGAPQNVCNNTLGAIDFRQNEAEPAAEPQPEPTEETTAPEETEAPAEVPAEEPTAPGAAEAPADESG